ncbi:GntR family transcriptional regulator [Amycolatopsis rhizosphaerae]|uniref:GntR family transcriptional regulator n=1 Tax=Amycolatopsis rhizosphaerae TaxID=2053003 RepID=A0A558CS46_9PSEU|nr:GntR family transcriptional regulator [Amycolatopsis rhizosphaerae]TVT51589.1 GntR family transcriptional regulator [Amycolatopsis rhizosphaerae]
MKVTHAAAPVRAQAVEAIRAEIVNGALKPGQRLVERELCERLDVSRNTVREACRQLEAEGFLVIPPHKGPIVARLSEEEARAIYEVREALECFAVRLFVERASDEMVAKLRDAVAKLGAAHDSGRVSRMLTAKNRFYDVLYSGAGNDVLHQQARLLHGRLAQLRARSLTHQGRPRASIEEIEEVVGRIAARDADTASALWRKHIHNAAATALAS